VETTIDSMGRIVVPKALRDALGLTPGSTVDLSRYGVGLQLVPAGRTARLAEVDGVLVADSTTPVTDDDVFGLLDATRR
jgi:AbrB family looped-hinge helix DNA binding protein